MSETKRASWGSKLGVMLAAAGSAVGYGVSRSVRRKTAAVHFCLFI